ncbi:complex I subunit 5 family protein, partial [Faecalicatena contorta]
MYTQAWILCSIFIPAAAGLLFLVLPAKKMEEKKMSWAAVAALALTAVSVALLLVSYGRGSGAELTLLTLTEGLDITFRLDHLGAFFLGFIALVWLLGGIFSVEYLHHEHHRRRFWGFYLLTLCALQGLSLAGNLVTIYLFFEMMTLVSMPLVLHAQSHEAVMAGLKYLFYSMCGAYMALFGVFVFYHFGSSMDFLPGGVMDPAVLAQNGTILHLGLFFMILGFGVKAGMFPMQAWLPTAHPVAPAPASAVLSAIIVKGGILAVLRSVYYIAGAEFLRGSWVQYAWLVLALITIFLGSMLAFKEPVFKKRLAYSSVSQASYIMLGMAILNPVALTGSLLHVLFHALIKTALFLSAGAVIYQTGYTRVDQLRGIGKEMPVTLWCYTFVSLAL